jgi:hypothetical protein
VLGVLTGFQEQFSFATFDCLLISRQTHPASVQATGRSYPGMHNKFNGDPTKTRTMMNISDGMS